MPINKLTWAGLFALVTAASSCGIGSTSAGSCDTDELPVEDPCYMKSCCDSVPLSSAADAGDGADAAPVQMRFCGACNG